MIVAHMVYSTAFLKAVDPLWEPDYFEGDVARVVSGWTIDHYRKYETAPKGKIKKIYRRKKRNSLEDEGEAFLFKDFIFSLKDLVGNEDNQNTAYLTDLMVLYFKRRSIKLLSEDLEYLSDNEDYQEAEKRIAKFSSVEKLRAEGIDPFRDETALEMAFASSVSKPLFKMPMALGKIMNEDLRRGSFIVLQGPEKRGKTFWLIELAMQASRQGNRVAFFQAGDMSQERQIMRFCIYQAKKSNREIYCGDFLLPVMDCQHHQLNTCKLKFRKGEHERIAQNNKDEKMIIPLKYEEAENHITCTVCRKKDKYRKYFKGAYWWKPHYNTPLTWYQAKTVTEKLNRKWNRKQFKLSTHPADTLSVEKSKRIMEHWRDTEGFLPEVVLFDYPDIMIANPNSRVEGRDVYNHIWKNLRGLAHEFNCLVIAVTQTDADSYDKNSLSLKNFSEDKRKYGHLTSLYGLNQTQKEKEAGLFRISQMLAREEAFNIRNEVKVMSCLQIGRPHLFSYF